MDCLAGQVHHFSISEMPQHSNCCVPGCTNNFRTAPKLQYYRIPKDKDIRKTYTVLLRNETLKLESAATRICSAHFEGGQKLSRHHLPSIFPWSKEKAQRRELKRVPLNEGMNQSARKQRRLTTDTQERIRHVNSESESTEDNNTTVAETQSDEKMTDVDCQTTFTMTDFTEKENMERELLTKLRNLKMENLALKEQNEQLKTENNKMVKNVNQMSYELNNPRFNIEKYKDNDEDVAFYTGFPDYNALMLCYRMIEDSAKNINYDTEKVYVDMEDHRKTGRPRVLTSFQEFLLVMMRLRLGLFQKDLSHRFSVSVTTVSRVTRTWVRFLRCEFEPLINIPPSEVIKCHMPTIFKKVYPRLTVIVDCTEVEMEKPSSLDAQSACYSSYKSRTTMKALLGITPSGVLCFVSEFFPGSTSDKEITAQSGFLTKLKPGDQVMADKGFNCQDELASVGATLVIPAFLKGTKQFNKEQAEHNKKVASFRIHVERLMERLKNWHIFDHKIPISLAPIATDILITVSALSNFHPPLIN